MWKFDGKNLPCGLTFNEMGLKLTSTAKFIVEYNES